VAAGPAGTLEPRVATPGCLRSRRGAHSGDEGAVHLTLTEPRTWTSPAESHSLARRSAFPDDVPGLVKA
jgi:hypothetical protein